MSDIQFLRNTPGTIFYKIGRGGEWEVWAYNAVRFPKDIRIGVFPEVVLDLLFEEIEFVQEEESGKFFERRIKDGK